MRAHSPSLASILTLILLGVLVNAIPAAAQYYWPVGDGVTQQQLNGTFMEYRPGPPLHFHDGIDIQGSNGTTVYAVDDNMTVTSISGPSTDRSVSVTDAYGWTFLYDHLGAVFVSVNEAIDASTAIGTTNHLNHLHFNDGPEGAEYNPLDPSYGVDPFDDTADPSITDYRIEYDGTNDEPSIFNGEYQVNGKVDFLVRASDAISGPGGGNVSVYGVFYQIFDSSNSLVASDGYFFDQWVPNSNVPFVYSTLLSTISTYWYTPTNDLTFNGYWDSETVSDGNYILCFDVYDNRSNWDSTCYDFDVANNVVGIHDGIDATGPATVDQGQSVTYRGTFYDWDGSGSTAIGPWDWEMQARKRDGSLQTIQSGSTFAFQQGGLWITDWNLTVPTLSGEDWLVRNEQVEGIVAVWVTDDDPQPGYHYAEVDIDINASNLASCVDTPAGLRAWYPLDELKGTNAADIVSGNDGTHHGGPAPTSGEVGNALSFDGVNDYVEIADDGTLDFGSGDFSLAFWITTTQDTGVRVLQDQRGSSWPNAGYHLHLYKGRIALQISDSSGYSNYNSSAFVADGEPHFVAVTVDRDGLGWVYVDGTLADTFNPTNRSGSLDNGSPLRLGRRSYGSGGYFAGTLDEFQIFDRKLTLGEIQEIHDAGGAGQCPCVQPPSDLRAWYTFDETSGSVAADLIHGNDGTHHGAPTPVPGSADHALGFDGVNDYVEAADHSALDVGTGDFSTAFWITTTQSTGVRVIQDKRSTTAPNPGYHVHLYKGKIAIQLADSSGQTNYNSSAFVADGQPHYVAITVDRDGLGRVYLDGEEVHTFVPTARSGSLDNSSSLRFGRRSFSSASHFSGTLDEFQLLDRLLQESEIRGAHNLGQCKPSTP